MSGQRGGWGGSLETLNEGRKRFGPVDLRQHLSDDRRIAAKGASLVRDNTRNALPLLPLCCCCRHLGLQLVELLACRRNLDEVAAQSGEGEEVAQRINILARCKLLIRDAEVKNFVLKRTAAEEDLNDTQQRVDFCVLWLVGVENGSAEEDVVGVKGDESLEVGQFRLEDSEGSVIAERCCDRSGEDEEVRLGRAEG